MTINLSPLETDFQINNSYLKTSYSNANCPYIKGKKFESIYGDKKIVLMDSYLNKYYISQMKNQENIRQEKKILEIIEKLDNKKAFNTLKDDYLREKLKIAKGYYLKQNDKKKEYFTNLFNLENYKDKLLVENQTNSTEAEFFSALMKYLICRPKKIIKKKDNTKIEALSKFKSFSKRKKKMGDIEIRKPKKRNSLQILLKENFNILSRTDNYSNNYNNSLNNKYNNTININRINNKKNLTLKLFDNDNNKKINNPFNKTYSTNLGLNNYNNLNYQKEISNNNEYNKDNNKNSLDNLKIEEIKVEQSLQNSISDSNYGIIDEMINENNYKRMSSIKNNKNLYSNNQLSSKKSIKITLSSDKKNLQYISKYNNKYNNNIKIIHASEDDTMGNKNVNNRNNNIISKFHISNKKIKNFFNASNDEEEKYEELKMIDLKIMNEKLNKKHKKIMKKFLEKIKIEEKNIKDYSNKLSTSLNIIKKNNQKYFFEKNYKNKKNKTELNLNRGFNTERIEHNNEMKNKKIRNEYDLLGKSKFSLPKVNKIIYGSLDNSKDAFEILQYNLYKEVKKKIEKKAFSKKLILNGRDIIDKLKIKLKSKYNF